MIRATTLSLETPAHSLQSSRRLRLMFSLTHPIQYYVKWCRLLGAEPQIELRVFYAYRQDTTFDSGFKRTYKWDIDLYSGYQSHTGPAFAPLKNKVGWWFLLWPRPLLEAFRHDCVLMLGFTNLTGMMILLLKPFHRAKIVLRQDSAHFGIRTRGFLAWGKRAAYRFLLKSVDTLLTQGVQNSNYFEYYGLPKSRHVSAPVIVDEDLFNLPSFTERQQLRAKHNITTDQVVFIVSGKFERRKRVDFVIRAFSKHASKRENTLLWLVGSGEMDEELRALAVELGVGSRVVFHGFVLQRQMSELYKTADCLVHAARSDPWPICILEAIRCGLVVVLSSSVGSVDDIVHQEVTGFRFGENAEHELINHLDLLSCNRALINKVAATCRGHMSKHRQENVIRAVAEACRIENRVQTT
jgi:glycosyltransferase involved in cell wall biosynthesis